MFMLISKMRFVRVDWKGVKQTYKSQKIGYFKGMKKDFKYVFGWMNELGYGCYSVTYVFFWMIMLSRFKDLNNWLYDTYEGMFYKKISNLKWI